jgi:hypothetical protein
MTTLLVRVLTILYLATTAAVALAQTTATTADRASWAISSAELAVSRALAYTGFADYADYSVQTENVSARLIDLDKSGYFLFRDSCAQQVWQIVFRSVRLHHDAAAVDSNEVGERDYDVLIDSKSGRLLRIHSIKDETLKDAADSLTVIEKKLRLDGQTEIIGLPNSIPEHAFAGLLTSTIADPSIPNEIIAYSVYVLGKEDGPKRVWSIDMRGIPPDHSPGLPSTPGFTRPKLSHFRVVWDAATGKPLFGVNAP